MQIDQSRRMLTAVVKGLILVKQSGWKEEAYT